MPFATVEQAIADIKAGKLIVVADDEDRENEGDLIGAAQLVTPEMIAFMVKRGGGLICLALPTRWGEWRIVGYRNDVDAHEHVALVYGDPGDGEGVLVRMHSKCLTGDVFGSRRCDCQWQLHEAMDMI